MRGLSIMALVDLAVLVLSIAVPAVLISGLAASLSKDASAAVGGGILGGILGGAVYAMVRISAWLN